MKKILSIMLTAIILMSVHLTGVSAKLTQDDGNVSIEKENGKQVITITGEDNIRKYQESLGEDYDPNLIAVRRTIHQPHRDIDEEISPLFIIREYYVKNKSSRTYTDYSEVLKTYNRPAGNIKISEGVSITTSFTASGGMSADFLEAQLGFSVSSTDIFQIEWSGKYSYPVKIKIYPIYEEITGEIWDKDVKYDDYVGDFTVKRALGDDVRVYRR